MLSKPHRHEPEVPDSVFDEIIRITGIASEWTDCDAIPFRAHLAVALEGEGWDEIRTEPAAQWSAAARDELRDLAATLRRAGAAVDGLSHDARGFVSSDNARAFASAAASFLRELELADARNSPRRGARPRSLRHDEFSGFYGFAAELIALIFEHGGRASCDKNLGRGTIVEALHLLLPYFPAGVGVPGFMISCDLSEGLHRLDRVRLDVTRGGVATSR